MPFLTSTAKCTLIASLLISASIFAASSAMAADETAAASDLNRQIVQEAPNILKQLKAKGYHNVAILKFRVKKGDEAPTDHAGTLNLDLAQRLELALILANDAQSPLGIVHDASSTAATISGANHRTADGRAKLFTGQYPLAWGDQKVTPDVFLIGVVQLSSDSGQMKVGIESFDPHSDRPEGVSKFESQPTVKELGAAGESFVLRGVFDQGSTELSEENRAKKAQTEAVHQVAMIRTSKKAVLPDVHPLSPTNDDAPVSLNVLYDGKAVPFEFRDGCAAIPEPREGQKVSFVLKRKEAGGERYAVVVKVNGENTLGRQRLADDQCRKWVLEPNDAPIPIRGYQVEGGKAQEFRVLSPVESKAREMDYGRDVGIISMVVFRERSDKSPSSPPAITDADEDFAVLDRNEFPAKPAPDFVALRQQLAGQVASDGQTRGLIAEGAKIESKTRKVTFVVDPIPVMSGVITYYHR